MLRFIDVPVTVTIAVPAEFEGSYTDEQLAEVVLSVMVQTLPPVAMVETTGPIVPVTDEDMASRRDGIIDAIAGDVVDAAESFLDA